MYTFTAIGPNLASLTGTTLEYASVYGVAGFPTWASVDGLQVWDLPAVCLQYGADITHMVVSEYGTPVGYLTLTPVAMGPICAACGDITCVADDAHHKVTGAPTNVAPYFAQANVARAQVAAGEAWVTEDTYEGIARQANGTARRAVREATGEVLSTWDVAPTTRDVWQDRETDRLDAQDAQGHAYLQTHGFLPTH